MMKIMIKIIEEKYEFNKLYSNKNNKSIIYYI